MLRTHSTCRDLAAAIRAGDDAAAARLAASLGVPPRLLTHRGLGPRGKVPAQAAADALAIVAALASSAPGARPADVCAAARRHRLGDPAVLDLVAGEVEAAAVHGSQAAHPWAAGLAALDALAEPALRAAALLLWARAAEGAGASPQAWPLVEQCLKLAPGLLPAVRDAAEYEMCAGNWARAFELADSIGDDPIAEPTLPALDDLRRPAEGGGQVARNQLCPCGSGRKYKACCLEQDRLARPHPLAARAPALYAMIATYAQRAPRDRVLDRMLSCAIGAPEAAMLAMDFAVFDGGAAGQFLADRGYLLRQDERELLGQWLSVPLDLYEVTWVRPGSRLRLRSLVGGPPLVEQHDRLLSLSAGRLDLILARLLPDGTRLRALGGIAGLSRDHRRQALALFPHGPVPPGAGDSFPHRLLSLFSQRPPRRFVTSEGEEYRYCETTLTVPGPDAVWTELRCRCVPPPRPPITDLAGYLAYLERMPGRWWCQTGEDEIEYVGKLEPASLTNLGTIRRGPSGRMTLTANSRARVTAMEEHVISMAPGAKVIERSARTAAELADAGADQDPAPDGAVTECRRRGIDLAPPEPVTVIMEGYYLPVEDERQRLARLIGREQAAERMLAVRDEDGLTPAEAVAAGGAALERVRALMDDCEWRYRRLAESGTSAELLPDPDELRRRVGLPHR